MKAILLVVLIAVSASALTRTERLKKRIADADSWDIAEGISGASAMGKVEGHESTLREAYNGLPKALQNMITNPTTKKGYFAAFHNPPAIVMGLQYPDMPYGGKDVLALGDDLPKPDHVNVVTFGTLFKLGSSGARNSFVAQTHYGCLQFWHGMAPEPYVQNGNSLEYRVWTNEKLSSLIKNYARRVWTVALNKLQNGDRNFAEFHLGRLLHTIGDSYARGHTYRDGSCGKILVFQEYNAEKGNHNHDDGDKPAKNPQQFKCSVERIRAVLSKWGFCILAGGKGPNCAFPSSVFDAVFEIHPASKDWEAGGAIEFFKSPTLTTAVEKTYDGKKIKIFYPPMTVGGKTYKKKLMSDSLADVCIKF